MDTTLEALLDAEAQRMDEVLRLLKRFLAPVRSRDGLIETPSTDSGRCVED